MVAIGIGGKEFFLQPPDVIAAILYRIGVNQPCVKAKGRRNGLDNKFLQGTPQAGQALVTVIAIDDQLGNQAVIKGRDRMAGIEA